MRKAFFVLLVLLLLCLGGAAAAVHYAAPAERLDLNYREISVMDKVKGMLSRRSSELEITEQDLNQILKQKLAQSPQVYDGITVTGARFRLEENRLTAETNLLYAGRLSIGAEFSYSLQSREGTVTARYKGARVKKLAIPPEWLRLPDFTVDLNSRMPSFAGIGQIRFAGHSIWIRFQIDPSRLPANLLSAGRQAENGTTGRRAEIREESAQLPDSSLAVAA